MDPEGSLMFPTHNTHFPPPPMGLTHSHKPLNLDLEAGDSEVRDCKDGRQ